MLFDSASDALIRWMGDDRRAREERTRIKRFADRFRLMSDDYRDLVVAELQRVFKDPNEAARVALLGDVSLNVFKQVTEELYRFTGAKRRFLVGDEPDPVYEQIKATVIDFDLISNEVSIALGAFNDCLVQILPAQLDDGGRPLGVPFVRVWMPHEVMVTPRDDDPSQPAEVVCEVMRPSGEVETIVWTEREHFKLGPYGEKLIPHGATSIENELGRLPFVAVHKGLRPDGFWDSSTGEDLVEFTLMHCAQWSSVRHLLHQQSYKQMVVTGVDEQWPGFGAAGPAATLAVGTGVAVDVLDLQADPRGQTETLFAMLAQKLASYGFNVEDFRQNPGQAPPSGLARYLSRQRILERRKRIAPFLLEAEYAIGELYRWAWNWNQPDKIADAAGFDCELIEESVVLSPVEAIEVRERQLAVFRMERDLGLKTAVEQIAEYRGVGPEEARRLAAEMRPETIPQVEQPETAPPEA